MSGDTLTFAVPGMSCGHCEAAVKAEIGRLDGVREVAVDLATKVVVVGGTDLDPVAIAAAVEEAGYDAVGLVAPEGGARA
jgi:copper chaperone CopZ